MKQLTMLMIVCCLVCAGQSGFAEEEKELLKARIGVKLCPADEACRRAKSLEQNLQAGDRIQIYLYPHFEPAYIYVLYNDQNTTRNLYQQTTIEEKQLVIIPEKDSGMMFYQFDGESSKESFMILCGPAEIQDVKWFFAINDLSYDAWNSLQKKLVQQSRPESQHTLDKPFGMAAAVKGVDVESEEPLEVEDRFARELPIFSGHHFVIRTYEFQFEK